MKSVRILSDPGQQAESLATHDRHIVICNINEKLPVIIEDLHRDTKKDPVVMVVLAQDLELWQQHPEWQPSSSNKRCIVLHAPPSDPRSLQLARVAQARAAIILADPRQGELADARSTLVAVSIEKQNREVHTVMELLSSLHRAHLRNTEVDEVVCLGDLSEKLIAQSCITPGVEGVFDRLLGARESLSRFYLPTLPQDYVGFSYRDLWRQSIEQRWPVVLCGFVRSAASPDARDLYVLNPVAGQEPGRDSQLIDGDRLIVIANHLVHDKSLRGTKRP